MGCWASVSLLAVPLMLSVGGRTTARDLARPELLDRNVVVFVAEVPRAEQIQSVGSTPEVGSAEPTHHHQYDPILQSLHGEPEYQAMIEEIEADMAMPLARVHELERNGELEPIPEVAAAIQ